MLAVQLLPEMQTVGKIEEYIWPENSSYLELLEHGYTGIYACMLQGEIFILSRGNVHKIW